MVLEIYPYPDLDLILLTENNMFTLVGLTLMLKTLHVGSPRALYWAHPFSALNNFPYLQMILIIILNLIT